MGGNFSTRKNGSPPVRHSSGVQMAPGRVMEYVLLMGVTAVSVPSYKVHAIGSVSAELIVARFNVCGKYPVWFKRTMGKTSTTSAAISPVLAANKETSST